MTLRQRLRIGILLGCCMATLGNVQVASVDAHENRPNIIFFLSDDQRNDQLGCAGNPILQTPNIDRIAADGMRFANAFVTTSICAASRASFFTGLHERSHRYTFGTVPLMQPATDIAWPGLLRAAGYRTGHIGKFGVAVAGGRHRQWFDFWKPLGRTPYLKPQADGSVRHIAEIAGDHAVDFLNQVGPNDRFCLQVSFNAAHAEDNDLKNHYPWPAAVDHLYTDTRFPPPRLNARRIYDNHPLFLKNSLNRERFHWRWSTVASYQRNMRGYYRLISGMDGVIGRITNALDRLGLAGNTVVIFASDNGYYMGQRGFAGKWTHYEESLRIPLLIADPRLPESRRGLVNEDFVLNIDVPATILDLAGVGIPQQYQGRSLVPLTDGTTREPWRTDFFCEHLMQTHDQIPKWEGVRGSRYVYARYFDLDPAYVNPHGQENEPDNPIYEFLHDLEVDPDQLVNLATDPAASDELIRMRQRCLELRDQYGGRWSPEKFPLRQNNSSPQR